MTKAFYLTFMGIAFAVGIILGLLAPKHRQLASAFIFGISVFIFAWKVIEFSIDGTNPNGTRPIEFSHLSYFILGTIIILGIKPLFPFAGFCSFISGFIYIIAAFVAPGSMMKNMPGHLLPFAMVSHSLLFIAGTLIMTGFVKFKPRQIIWAGIGSVCIIGYGLLVKFGYIFPNASNRNSSTLLQLIDGTILSSVIGAENITESIRIWSRIGAAVIYALLLVGYTYANIGLSKIKGVEAHDYGIYQVIKRRKQEKRLIF